MNAHGIFDGIVCIGACDKVVPALLMAAVRINLPTIVIPGAAPDSFYIKYLNNSVYHRLENKKSIDVKLLNQERYIKRLLLEGKITEDEFVELYKNTISSCDICRFYATGGSMACFSVAVGMSPADAVFYPDNIIEKKECIRSTGEQIMKLIREDIKPSDIVNKHSFINALRTVIAFSGSMNVIIHSLAIVNELKLDFTLDDIYEVSNSTPYYMQFTKIHSV